MRALLLALPVLASAGWLAPEALAPESGPPPEGPLIRALDRPRGGDVLLKLNPISLKPVSPPLRTFREFSGFAFSPDFGQLALGGGFLTRGRLQLVDVQGWRTRVLRLGVRAPVRVIRWVAPDRLLVGLGGSQNRRPVGIVDPLRGVIVRRRAYRGFEAVSASGGFGIVSVVSRPRRLRAARLVHFDPRGNLRSTPLPRIAAGVAERGRGRRRSQRVRLPGLAIDPERGIAYVVAAGRPLVAEVELASGRVAYHPLAQRPTLGAAERAHAAKRAAFDEWTPAARWLGDGALAVSGEHRRTSPGRSFWIEPFGARLIDTRSWAISLLARRPTSIASAPNLLLATGRRGVSWDHAGRRDAGLLAFDARGRRLFKRFRGEDVTVLGVHLRYAYAWVRRTRRLYTLELGSGHTVHSQRVGPARLPPLLVPEGFAGEG